MLNRMMQTTRTIPGELEDEGQFLLVREFPADLETPVSIYLKLASDPGLTGPTFLLESVTGGEHVARYSFIGVQPRKAYVLQGQQFKVYSFDTESVMSCTLEAGQDPLAWLKGELAAYRRGKISGLPRFSGGLVGYLGYEAVRFFEPSVPAKTARGCLPEAVFLLADTIVAFDHAYGKVILLIHAKLDDPGGVAEAESRLDRLQAHLRLTLPARNKAELAIANGVLTSNFEQDEFERAVRASLEHIAAGDVFQLVLSQRFSRQTMAKPFDIYRALRGLNPSPYMFYFDFGKLAGEQPLQLIGASPEVHVRLEGDLATLRPIAGTRRRGRNPSDDHLLAEDLLSDPKERAEHVMLVDLARNDLGRVCDFGSVMVRDLLVVEHYSHVMHLVSQVEGRLRAQYDAFDLLRATFPAGTVSGAPKIRAMQIIHDLEPDARGPYAGAVGYIGFDGTMDTCITIRTLVMQGDIVSLQAGAGIVADSDPTREYHETINKAAALAEAIRLAEQSGISYVKSEAEED